MSQLLLTSGSEREAETEEQRGKFKLVGAKKKRFGGGGLVMKTKGRSEWMKDERTRNPQESLKFADWKRSTHFCSSPASTRHSLRPPVPPVCPSFPPRTEGRDDWSEDKDSSFNLDSAMGELPSA